MLENCAIQSDDGTEVNRSFRKERKTRGWKVFPDQDGWRPVPERGQTPPAKNRRYPITRDRSFSGG